MVRCDFVSFVCSRGSVRQPSATGSVLFTRRIFASMHLACRDLGLPFVRKLSSCAGVLKKAPHAVSCLAPAIEKCLAVVVRHRVRSRRVFSVKRRRTSVLSVYWRTHLPTAADGSAAHRNDTDDVDGRRRQFSSFLLSLACSFCALLVTDGCM